MCGPSGGMLTTFEPPSGPGVRVDTYGAYPGYTTNPNFDSLLGKVIAYSASADFSDVIGRTCRALAEFRIEGVDANLSFLEQSLSHDDFSSGEIYTRWVDDHVAELTATPEIEVPAQNGASDSQAGTGWSAARHPRSAGRTELLPRGLRYTRAQDRASPP